MTLGFARGVENLSTENRSCQLSLNHVQVFETTRGVENNYFVVGLDPPAGHQTAQRCDAGGAFGAKENSFRFCDSRDFRQHLIVPDAECRAVARADILQKLAVAP